MSDTEWAANNQHNTKINMIVNEVDRINILLLFESIMQQQKLRVIARRYTPVKEQCSESSPSKTRYYA